MFDLKQQLAIATWQKKITDKLLDSELVKKYALSIMVIHDEIVITIPEEHREKFIKELEELKEVIDIGEE